LNNRRTLEYIAKNIKTQMLEQIDTQTKMLEDIDTQTQEP